MAKKQVLNFLFWVLVIPLIVISRWFEKMSSERFRTDLEQCLDVVDQFKESVPYPFVRVLIEAEDHRNAYHFGVDPIGVLRAVWVWLIYGHTQGASTIEQQFVRVVTGRYERTAVRKLREQLLAIAIVRHRPKKSIASAYLAIAFFGSGCVGLDGLKSHFGHRFHSASAKQALRFVTRLKYPRPLQPSARWHSKVNARCEAIWLRRDLGANKSLQRTFKKDGISFFGTN
ncbi:transglycosylase domain-containing protein [Hydrogenovibrio halophilus]|uniref:transglycosylase domain-containing protein n=1 Tax=Hydrogenovibrio halophilus TaxID=373391 RepID=UPI0003817F0A|nr:transglycosylase domain-containing protein [Hydrogenovibrio halophilus]